VKKSRGRKPPSLEEARDALLLFCEKADLLQKSTLAKDLKRRKQLRVQVTYTARSTSVRSSSVKHDPVAAFVLTVRFFVQDNEATSIRRLAVLYAEDSLPIPSQLREEFRKLRQQVKDFLDAPSAVGLFDEARQMPYALTRRMVFEAFMWGDLAHATHEKSSSHRALRRWFQTGDFLESLARNQFVVSLATLCELIVAIRDVNLLALEHLSIASRQAKT